MENEVQRRSLNQLLRGASKSWHGVKRHRPDWSPQSHSLALSAELPEENLSFYIIFNAYWEALAFELPAQKHGAGQPWRRWIDTSLESPLDIQDWPAAAVVAGRTYRAGPRSVVVLIAAADVARPIPNKTDGRQRLETPNDPGLDAAGNIGPDRQTASGSPMQA
jgi:glycogen operon protein